jgi:hypothetical protein
VKAMMSSMMSAFAAVAFAGGATAGEAVLVHDIAPPHPRTTQLTQSLVPGLLREPGA